MANVAKLIKCIIIYLLLIAGVEYFKYSTRIHYEWFHCTPIVQEFPGTTMQRLTAVGGLSCDRRGQIKTLVKKITRTYEPFESEVSFCIEGDEDVVAFVAYEKDAALLRDHCSHIIKY